MAVRIGVLADSSLVTRRLAPSRTVLRAAPDYLAAHGRPAVPDDLARHDCLIYSYRTGGRDWHFGGSDGLCGVKISGRLGANNGDILLVGASSGLGIALLPSFIAADDRPARRLERVLPAWRFAEEPSVCTV
jgi:DNA-binding transcriptional LysR family regulator